MKPYGHDLNPFNKWISLAHYHGSSVCLHKRVKRYIKKAARRKYKQDLQKRKDEE